jgi:hypothetical protein
MDRVKAAFWYGASAFQSAPSSTNEPDDLIYIHEPLMTGWGAREPSRVEQHEKLSHVITIGTKRDHPVPMLMMFGSEEDNYVGKDQRGWVTFQQWHDGANDDKAFLVLEGLDHNGMTDVPITYQQNPIPSTLPPEIRAALVADSVDVWLDTVLLRQDGGDEVDSSSSSSSSDDDAYYLNVFCEIVEEEIGEDNVRECVANADDGDDDHIGLKVALPVSLFVVALLMFLIALYLQRRHHRHLNLAAVSHHDDGVETKAKEEDDDVDVEPSSPEYDA